MPPMKYNFAIMKNEKIKTVCNGNKQKTQRKLGKVNNVIQKLQIR